MHIENRRDTRTVQQSLADHGALNRNAFAIPQPQQDIAVPIAPGTATIEALTGLWQQVLKVESLGAEDNFFEMGGTSLLAARLFVRMEQEFRIRLPLSALLRHPTIATLMPLLQQEEKQDGYWNCLVPIQPNGGRPPFFCAHALGPSLIDYRLLSDHMGQDQPFYGFQAQGLDGIRPPLASFEEMAACYIAEMRMVQSKGPYRLGGRSLGGMIAFEMARQLEEAGESIALIVLIDSDCRLAPQQDIARGHSLTRLDHSLGMMMYRHRKEPLPYLTNRLKSRLPQRLAAKLGAATDIERVVPPALQRVAETNYQALAAYAFPTYRGRVVQLLASDTPHRTVRDPRLGWGSVAEEGMEVQFVSGNHETMMKDPHVVGLAATLRRCLDRSL